MKSSEVNNQRVDIAEDERKPGLLTTSRLTTIATIATVSLLVLAIGGLLAGRLDPFGDVDLTVWLNRDTLTVLPVQQLPFTTVIEVEISNSGSTSIGKDHRPWRLTLLSNDPAEISKVGLLGDLQKEPPNILAKEITDSDQDSLTLVIGLLNPGDSIKLKLKMTRNGDAYLFRPGWIDAQARVPGLSRPRVTGQSPSQLVKNWWMTGSVFLVFGLIFIIFFGVLAFESSSRRAFMSAIPLHSTVKSIAYIVFIFLGSAYVSAMISVFFYLLLLLIFQ
ncbi:MAG: hypothetical protein ACE5Q6_17510 [Dehalococcoidia bacterium]